MAHEWKVIDLYEEEGRTSGKKYRARVRINGKYKNKSFDEHHKAEAWAETLALDVKQKKVVAGSTKVWELAQEYCAECRSLGRTDLWIKEIQWWAGKYLKAGLTDIAADGFQTKAMTYIAEMKTKKGEASDGYKTKGRTVLKALSKFAYDNRYLPYDALARMKLKSSGGRKEKKVFTIEEIRVLVNPIHEFKNGPDRALLEYAMKSHDSIQAAADSIGMKRKSAYYLLNPYPKPLEDHYWLWAVLMAYTGQRPTMAAYLRWEWIDWDNNLIKIPPECPGNKPKRYVYCELELELRTILEERYHVGKQGRIAHEALPEKECARSKIFDTYLRRCKIDKQGRSAHSLRHCCGSLMAAMKLPDLSIAKRLGHATNSEMNHYASGAITMRKQVLAEGWGDSFYFNRTAPTDAIVITDDEATA